MTENKQKYAAMLLFQYRFKKNGILNKKRICEERIIHIFASSAEEAYKLANKIGKDEELKYYDSIGEKMVYLDFIGILDLIDLLSVQDEIWSRYVEMLYPMERKNKILKPKEKLTVFRNHKGKIKLL